MFETRFQVKYNIFQALLVYLLVRNRHLYQNLSCDAHFQFNNHDLFENVDWN